MSTRSKTNQYIDLIFDYPRDNALQAVSSTSNT